MKRTHEIFLDKVMSRRRFGIKPGLENMSALMALLGHPERNLKFVHVAGTNGKGAVCAIVESALFAAGLKTGRYTSPHLVSVNERFSINTMPVDDDLLARAADEIIPAVEKLETELHIEITFFECLTAIAFVLFKKADVDIVVLETGLGGAFDATNIIPAEALLCAVITRIGLDHCDWLGDTYEAIAKEKAGIVKESRPLVLGKINVDAKNAILSVASEKKATITMSREDAKVPVTFALAGEFQKENARTAITVLNVLKNEYEISISEEAIEKGFSSVVWPGRCQLVEKGEGCFIVDGAHNPDAAIALCDTLRKYDGPIALIVGFCGDKDVDGHLRVMSEIVVRAWCVTVRNERALSADDVSKRAIANGIQSDAAAGLDDAIDKARQWMKETGGRTVICGSLFLAAEALQNLDAFPWKSVRIDDNEKVKT